MFFGRTDAKAETPVFWPPPAKSWLIGKDSDAGRDWGQEGKGMTEDEMVGWHHWLNGCEFEWTLGVGDEQGDLACCDSLGRKESDTTERLNWTELITKIASKLSPQKKVKKDPQNYSNDRASDNGLIFQHLNKQRSTKNICFPLLRTTCVLLPSAFS